MKEGTTFLLYKPNNAFDMFIFFSIQGCKRERSSKGDSVNNGAKVNMAVGVQEDSCKTHSSIQLNVTHIRCVGFICLYKPRVKKKKKL